MIISLFVWFFNLKGWKIEGAGIPAHLNKCVIIAMPHTSNWDFVYSMAAIRLFKIELNYLAKKELFQWPIKNIFINTGGIPVERNKNTRMVDIMISKFKEPGKLFLVISAEGTRRRVEKIKSGFYHVALATGVPICMAYLDYGKKIAGFSEPFYPSGDKKSDAVFIKDFYRDKKGKFPWLFNLDAIKLDG